MNWTALGVIGGLAAGSLLLLYALAAASGLAERRAQHPRRR